MTSSSVAKPTHANQGEVPRELNPRDRVVRSGARGERETVRAEIVRDDEQEVVRAAHARKQREQERGDFEKGGSHGHLNSALLPRSHSIFASLPRATAAMTPKALGLL